jgi:hypothetical protein
MSDCLLKRDWRSNFCLWHASFRCGANDWSLLGVKRTLRARRGRVEVKRLASRAEESHLRALPKPCVNLSIHTASDVRPLAHAASGFTSSTGSSCCQMASVGPWPRLNNAAPSVQLHYRAFIPNTSCSAPVLRIGTLILAVLAACDFSLCIGGQVLTFRTKAWLSFAPPTCRMPLRQTSGFPRADPGGRVSPRF